MLEEENLYLSIGANIDGAIQSQMFGKPCFKINGKAFVCFFKNEMVFKLTGETHKEALSLDGSQLFDPSGKKRAMKEWVQVSFNNKDRWLEFAHSAFEYVIKK
ncbi:hypothetical protein [Pedobacter paludis]|uniref:TfoX N-terminal domain-containing protein n=1 Tax=Pedobacter paludis TaxID=2203212 RepID=A0A317F1I8_9SPHI|nr:hypothetical protein [Pedobacter paludis]PWS31316.1 hypothetical protein DF947_11975 [Pedobacter paludis]